LNFNILWHFRVIALAPLLLISACTSTSNHTAQQEQQLEEGDSRDPLEVINRPFWVFTWDYADKYVAKPASDIYTTYTPPFLRTGLYNMALNLNEPASVINNLLKFKFYNAAKRTGRFVLNSTVGMLGFFDPASDFEWTGDQEEFGEVLGFYGVSDGPYLVVPALGPSSVREEVGDYVDGLYWPLAVIDFWPNMLRLSILALEGRASLRDQEQLVVESMDSYEFVKNAYFQNMNYRLYDGSPPIIVDEEHEAEIDAYLEELDE
jgi:phospholipid-binding lipoprotein MlaA